MTSRTTVARTLDLNADLGEGIATSTLRADQVDDALLGIVTSANVACGGHAGDDASMARVCAIAVERGVAIGAQVSYVDRAGFGRGVVERAVRLQVGDASAGVVLTPFSRLH
jgi:UPF0271 protein